jgi:hypothetical protein
MREVFEILDRLGVRHYVTGSEALPRYGEPRQTMDIDIVIDLSPADFGRLAAAFEHDYLVNPPIDFGGHLMASVMPLSALGKADLILSRDDAWSRSAMDRRQPWSHPLHGNVWVISLEDLILAKLAWSEGTSELQLRDCRHLIAQSGGAIDWPYLERWASSLGLTDLLKGARDAA